LVKKLRPDVIQGWMYHGNFAANVAGWLAPGRPIVAWNVRQSLYSLAEEKLLTSHVIKANRRLSARADAIVYNSHLSRRQHEAFGFSPDRGRVIPNGFDLEQFRPAVDRGGDLRRELGIPAGARLIGHVARFHPMKDHAGFVRAAVSVAQLFEDVQVMLAGWEVTENNEALSCLVPDVLRNRFHFLGEREDVATLMQAMDIFCQSSWSEAFPNVLGEAMACQTPCVATDVGDSAVVVADTGIVVPPRNGDAMVAGLLAMLSKSEAERRALGRAARARVEANYALPRIVAQYANLYEQLTKRM
jgi:glycosyltransferase involved in cell wall biosynthesis